MNSIYKKKIKLKSNNIILFINLFKIHYFEEILIN